MATVPTIHLNGTGATALKEEYWAAYEAIDAAIEKLSDATLNGRDFYPQGPEAYQQARKERTAAFQKLHEARLYVAEMLAGICDQQP
jgi:hypothetical protein